MNYPSLNLTKPLFLATSLALGCGDSGGVPAVDSQLPGVYEIDRFQATPTDEASLEDPDICDQLMDSDLQLDFLVLFSFLPNDDLDEARLGAIFCADIEECRDVASRAPEPLRGYSFRTGDDQTGWLGWGIQDSGLLNDQCKVDVQAHTLTSTADTIDIQTETSRTVYDPRPEDVDGTEITCRIVDAIDNLNDSLPCIGAFSLQATFAAGL